MRRLAALAVLGFASGMPYQIPNDVLSAWLTQAGVGMVAIGAAGLLSLPWSLKPLWAPLLDAHLPTLGRRRGWLVAAQAVLAAATLALGAYDPAGGSLALLLVLTAVAVAGATQDIAADAWRSEVCGERERGPGAAASVIGYRLAVVCVPWLAVRLEPVLGWSGVFAVLALLFAIQVVISLLRPEPPPTAPLGLAASFVEPWRELWRRWLWGLALLLLAAAAIRACDVLAGRLALPFLIERLGAVAAVDLRAGVGTAATMAGSALGGWLVLRLGLLRALPLAVALAAISNLAYAGLALIGPDALAAGAAIAAEHGCGGILGATMVAWFMSLCAARCAAAQYALLTALTALPGLLLGGATGLVQQQVGWSWFFALTALAALPALLLLRWLRRPWAADLPP